MVRWRQPEALQHDGHGIKSHAVHTGAGTVPHGSYMTLLPGQAKEQPRQVRVKVCVPQVLLEHSPDGCQSPHWPALHAMASVSLPRHDGPVQPRHERVRARVQSALHGASGLVTVQLDHTRTPPVVQGKTRVCITPSPPYTSSEQLPTQP